VQRGVHAQIKFYRAGGAMIYGIKIRGEVVVDLLDHGSNSSLHDGTETKTGAFMNFQSPWPNFCRCADTENLRSRGRRMLSV